MPFNPFFVEFNLREIESSHGLNHGVKAEWHLFLSIINHFI